MVYIDIKNCGNEKYKLMIDYIFISCNYISFHLPNFNNSSNDNIKINDDGNINGEYIEYLLNNKGILDLCYKNGAKVTVSKSYLGSKFGYMTKIFSVKMFSKIKQMILKNNLFDWKYPDLPEDLSFYKNTECKFRTIAHEESFILFNETKEDLSFLDKEQFSYFRIK